MSAKGKPYGSEYRTVYKDGNIKFVKANSGSATAPLETMTKGRVYVTLGSGGELRYISYYDSNNKKFKQIDIAGKPHPVDGAYILPHTHKGYIHDEHGTFALTEDENGCKSSQGMV